jgi:hypothetical protein
MTAPSRDDATVEEVDEEEEDEEEDAQQTEANWAPIRTRRPVSCYHRVQEWTVKEYMDALTRNVACREITVPPFQRSVVWSMEDSRAFIETLQLCQPCGVLTLFKSEYANSEHYSILDGQQRAVTMLRYYHSPFSFLKGDPVVDITPRNSTAVFLDGVREWIQNLGSYADICMSRSRLYTFLTVKYRSMREEDNKVPAYRHFGFRSSHAFSNTCNDVMTMAIQLVCSIDNVKVPHSVYYGPVGDIARIYEMLNRKNTRMADNDRYAVEFMRYGEFVIANHRVVDALHANYVMLADQRGIPYDGSFNTDPSTFRVARHNFHEFCRGFGVHIAQQFPDLFGDKPDGLTVAFSLFRCVSGVASDSALPGVVMGVGETVEGLGRDAATLPGFTFGEEGQLLTEARIMEALQFLREVVTPYQMSVGKRIFRSVAMVASMVGRFCRLQENTDAMRRFRRNLAYHIMYDTLHGDVWSNNVYQQAHTRSTQPHYENTIPLETWNTLKATIFQKQLQKDMGKTRQQPCMVSQWLLKFTTSNLMSGTRVNRPTLEFDHIIPYKTLHCLKAELGDDVIVPGNHVGNFCILDKKTNRRKKDNTVLMYVREEQRATSRTPSRTELETESLYHDMDELDFVDSGELTLDRYLQYVRMRFDCIWTQFMQLNSIA